MPSRSSRGVAWLTCCVMLGTSAVHAGGGGFGSIVYDPQNFAENQRSAMQMVRQTRQLADQHYTQLQQYYTQMRQYEAQVRNMQRLAEGITDSNSGNILDRMRKIRDFTRGLDTLYEKLGGSQETVMQAYREYHASGLELPEWVEAQSGDLEPGDVAGRNNIYQRQANQTGALANTTSLSAAQQSLLGQEQAWNQIQTMQDAIQDSPGLQASMDNLNNQMGMVLAQNQQLLQLTATQQIADGQEARRRAHQRETGRKANEQTRTMLEKSEEAGREWHKLWAR